jgi:hypothetical protein
MDPRLQQIQRRLEDSYTITRTQYTRGTLLAWDRDHPTEYKISEQGDTLELREADSVGGGTHGGYEFTDPDKLASFITSNR